MHGVSTIDILLHAPGVKLAALFAPEHGLRGEYPAGSNFTDHIDARTGLPVHSLYNGIIYDGIGTGKPTKAALKGIDAMVIDLQDVGVRSYTFVSAMRMCMEGCFENGVEVVVLDRPNPLGGLKVGRAPADPSWSAMSGQFRVPYVHGLTDGGAGEDGEAGAGHPEAAGVRARERQADRDPDARLAPLDAVARDRAGLGARPPRAVPTYSAAEGYAMVGLGTQIGGFKSGVGTDYPFRGISYHGRALRGAGAGAEGP